jgi:hypothetical protein
MHTKGLTWAGPFALYMALLIGCSALPETTLPPAVAPASAPAGQLTTMEPVPSSIPSLSTQPAPTTTAVRTLPTNLSQSTTLAGALTPSAPPITWIHKQFADAWSLEYPATWNVNAAGVDEGAVEMRGDYNGHRYVVAFVYPIFEQAVDTFSLEAWIAQELATLPADQRSAITVSDVIIAGAPAKKVLNFPGTSPDTASHHLYIWRSGDRNPRLVTIQAADNQPPDMLQMAQLFDRFLAGIAVPATPLRPGSAPTSMVHLDNPALTSQLYQQVKDGTPIVEIADPKLWLPDDIHPGQIKKYFQLGTLSIGLVLQPSMNVMLDLPNQYVPSFTGLIVSQAGTPWHKYLEIRDAERSDKNNPYYLWAQDGQLYLSIVDQVGAGSGEGNMKLVRLAATGNWEVVDCYYFGASYSDPQRDGDYFGFSQHLNRQEKESASLCRNGDIVPLP